MESAEASARCVDMPYLYGQRVGEYHSQVLGKTLLYSGVEGYELNL